jgi:hypothetical protein
VVGVRLYLEDVRALFNELATALGGAHMETDEYELDGPDDLLNLGRDRLSTLTLHGADSPRVFVNIGPQGASVRRLSDDPQVIVLAQNLRHMLLGCRGKLHWLPSPWLNALFYAMLIGAMYLLFWGDHGTSGVIAGFVLAALALLGNVVALAMKLYFGAVVYLRGRSDSRSFLKRNSDTLIVTGVVSLVTAVVSALLTYYLTKKK